MTVTLMIQIALILCVISISILGVFEVMMYDAFEQEITEIRDELESLEE
ncbi:hypothetical protein CUW_0695 [Turicibacter sanguinis PC909]|uniref:Uncharacterized protein n=1 Tax=Turicibacter sanguinis PC909 TaxID=702450 RepID=A0ABN0A552_9FIRM|nr:hypothetical protein [Turicibacter sanguinis]EFF64873.1 hypothetical protein CUW_0695 [Turicibacter sanguinis PC909]MCU7190368.1 hypothetical protein [Turicibacter sanguinis]MCU7210794.1 hypothetical protein [Turicibacter sanguinis]MDB8542199.1 hypothetical protein [Turicibacter sanguinis]MDB8543646.1 hypothetical protein [Turicibacter sanguinis]